MFLKHPNARIEFPNSSARYVPEKQNTPLLQASVITVQFIVEERLRNDEFNKNPRLRTCRWANGRRLVISAPPSLVLCTPYSTILILLRMTKYFIFRRLAA